MKQRTETLARPVSRRSFLGNVVRAAGSLGLLSFLGGCGGGRRTAIPATAPISEVGPLLAADSNGVRLPAGFTSRIVARSGERVVGSSGYVWHAAPDGGGVFSTLDGWIYVSNSEITGSGGVGALRFQANGTLIDGYPILTGTSRNCAGGATPWGTWLSCEEVADGRVWECDPLGRAAASVHPALGVFNHEAVAVDPFYWQLYLTEDRPDGRLYRFTPDAMLGLAQPDLQSGLMEVAELTGGPDFGVLWHTLPDPLATITETRYQVPTATPFNGGEGIFYHAGIVYFSTKGDNRIWAYTVATAEMSVVYDAADFTDPLLTGVDNLTVSTNRDVFVAEDGGNLQIVAVTHDGEVVPIVELVGHDLSEVTGPAFDPTGRRLYFSSQRGITGNSADGITFVVQGPFA